MDFFGHWDVIIGALTVGGMTVAFLKFINHQLPSKKLHVMFDLLDDTDAFLLSCCEEGLVHGSQVVWFRDKLTTLRSTADVTRLEVHSAKTYYEDFYNLLRGLTWNINYVCRNVRDVRSDISTSSQRERERRVAQENARREPAHTIMDTGDAEEGTPVDSAAASEELRHVRPLVPATTLVAVSAVTCNPEDGRLAEPHGEIMQASNDAMRISDTSSTKAPPDGGCLSDAPMALSARSISAETQPEGHRPFCAERRFSACSSSSGASSTRGLQCKKGGSQRSRTRAFARFLRKARSQRPSLYLVDLQKLSTVHIVEDDDEDWEDELSVRVAV